MVRPESDLTLESLAERIESLEKRLSGKLDPQAYIGVPVVRASAPAGSVPISPASASVPSSQADASVMPARFATEGSSAPAASSVSSASVQPPFAQTGTASVSQTSSNALSPKKQPVAEQVAAQRIPSSAQNTQSFQSCKLAAYVAFDYFPFKEGKSSTRSVIYECSCFCGRSKHYDSG